MTKKEMEEKLAWWLNFIETDLENLSEKERNHLQIDFSFNYAPWISPADILQQGGYDLASLKAAQTIIKEFLKKVLNLEGPRGEFLPPLRREFRFSSDGSRFEIAYLPFISVAMKITSKGESPERDWLLNEFSRLLEGISKDAIKRCEECKRLFLHLSGKEKKYCSSKCAYKFLSRKKREELKAHPRKYRAYLKKQREMMKKKYDEKIKAEHPMARIGRKER